GGCRRTTWPAAWSERSSATPRTTVSPGASTSRQWSPTGPTGPTSTRPAGRSTERPAVALHLFGIRHHGPGSARTVVRALEEVRPDIVLIEAPAEATSALRWVGGPDPLVPPVALLGYAVDDPRRA